jgi:hypothetical protein
MRTAHQNPPVARSCTPSTYPISLPRVFAFEGSYSVVRPGSVHIRPEDIRLFPLAVLWCQPRVIIPLVFLFLPFCPAFCVFSPLISGRFLFPSPWLVAMHRFHSSTISLPDLTSTWPLFLHMKNTHRLVSCVIVFQPGSSFLFAG